MTAEDFNEKYKDYIEPRFEDQGLMINCPKTIDFLDEIFSTVLVHIPDFKYSQIKLKFNTSRVYMEPVPATLTYWIETVIYKFIKDDRA